MTSTMKLTLYLCLFLCVFAQYDFITETDIIDYQDYQEETLEPEIINVQEEDLPEDRALLGFPKLRIAVDFTYLTAGTNEFKTYVTTELVPSVVSYFNAALKIKKPLMTPIQSTSTSICGVDTPQALKDGVRADIFVILYSKEDTTGGWMAATTSCALASGDKRPIVVKIGINTFAIGTASIDTNPLTHDLYINTISHEFIHALAMNGVYFKNFVDKNGKLLTNHVKKMDIGGTMRNVVDLEPLTTRLRNFYGCPTIPGIFMENDSSMAHIEKRFFQHEVMASGGTLGSKISEFSLAFLEGSGWYVPDYSYAEPFFFGQGQGCGFIYESCDPKTFDEYCEGTGRGCLNIGSSGGHCKVSAKSESCRYYVSQREFNCENPSGIYYTTLPSRQVFGRGLGSKCFTGNLTTKKNTEISQTSYCFTYNCIGEGVDTTLEVNFGTTKFVCLEKGQVSIPGYNGFVDCPDPLKFCSTIGKPTCPKNCMGRGKCVNGKCQCNSGFQGTDCGFTL